MPVARQARPDPPEEKRIIAAMTPILYLARSVSCGVPQPHPARLARPAMRRSGGAVARRPGRSFLGRVL